MTVPKRDNQEDRVPPADAAPTFSFRPRRRRAAKDDSGPVSIADLMVPTLARLGLKTRAQQMQLANLWPEVVGDMVAEHTQVVAFVRGRLTIETDSPSMGHALRVQRQDIIDRINRVLGRDAVADMRFRLAREKS